MEELTVAKSYAAAVELVDMRRIHLQPKLLEEHRKLHAGHFSVALFVLPREEAKHLAGAVLHLRGGGEERRGEGR